MHPNDYFRRGTGSTLVEIYLGPLCPYSALAFGKVEELLEILADEVTIQVRVHPQPWNPFSSGVARCIWAAAVAGGDEAGLAVMRAVYDDLDAYDWTGEGMEMSLAQLIARVESAAGVEFRSVFESSEARAPLAWTAKYSRQNGVHGSPTFAINGVVEPTLESGQTPQAWSDTIRDRIG